MTDETSLTVHDGPPGEQQCRECLESFPLTAEYFNRDSFAPTGFRNICKTCKSRADKEHRLKPGVSKDVQSEAKRLDEQAMAAVDVAARGGRNVPHAAEVLEKLLECFGGSEGLARQYFMTFLNSKQGSQQRFKCLERVLTLVERNTGLGGAELPLELMSETDIERELRRLTVHDPDKEAEAS